MKNKQSRAINSPVMVLCSDLFDTMTQDEHKQHLKHRNYLFWGAMIATAVTSVFLLSGLWFAIADPTGLTFKVLTTLFVGTPSGAATGALFVQYNRMQRRASELLTQLSQERRFGAGIALSGAIDAAPVRNASHAALAERLVTNQTPVAAREAKARVPSVRSGRRAA